MLSCRKPYNPPAIAFPGSYLVVEGVINANGLTTVKLSRTVNLNSNITANPLTGATVAILGSQNNTYPLTETTTGTYLSDSLNLNNALQYRLSIKTADNGQYLSDFETVQITPPIDSIGFNVSASGSPGINVYANTHDPTNNIHYFRWSYEETWEFHAKYASTYITNGFAIVPRPLNLERYYCFANDTSSDIVLGSSAKLVKDVIYQNTVAFIPSSSEKIEVEYSILLHQYALTGDAYNFWTNLKTNTEQLGSIFDAQPSNINGNIHNVNNPTEPVIGYISVNTVQTKRVFISENQLPQSWVTAYPYDCTLDSNYFAQPPTGRYNQVLTNLIPLGSSQIPVQQMFYQGQFAGYMSSTIDCTDCTLQGTQTEPSFWK
jgi:hypothetical protein